MKPNTIGSEYMRRLQAVYHRIDGRGIMVSPIRLAQAKKQVQEELDKQVSIIKNIWGCHVYLGAGNNDGSKDSVNLNATSGTRTPMAKLKELGYKIPKVSYRNEDGDYLSRESLAELSLQKILMEKQDPVIVAMLSIREFVTIQSRYLNANLLHTEQGAFYLTNYNVAGTTTGRRSSRKHAFGFGNNAQNFPKHGIAAEIYRRVLVARPGMIFLMVDQMQAEDWPVGALAQNTSSLNELITGVDRHKKLACAIFNLSPEHYTEKEWKKSIERYIGKKTRHANNYGMAENTMSESLAKEGKSFAPQYCKYILDIANQLDPSIKGVFHKYVEKKLNDDRMLKTPWGRERQFFGLRGVDPKGNSKIYREAYSYIPQSTVGDNTGFAVYDLETESPDSKTPPSIIQESHDSIVQEIPDNADSIWYYLQRTIRAFSRKAVFDNGFEIEIPVEGEIGFDFDKTITLQNNETGSKKLTDIRYKDIQIFYNLLKEQQAKSEAEDQEWHKNHGKAEA